MKLIFATNNLYKIKEINKVLKDDFEILTLIEVGITEDIPEPFDTLEENALAKVRFLHQKLNENCFADDTGLEIESLNNEPGVYSARYAGEDKNSENNMQKVLKKLKNKDNRKAQFRTIIALILENKEYLFEGIVKGEILHEKYGKDGFGYDPIFLPDGYKKSFAEISLIEKNKISHRGKAVQKLVDFLKKL